MSTGNVPVGTSDHGLSLHIHLVTLSFPFWCLLDGVHEAKDHTPEYTEAHLPLMQTQVVRYVQYKRSIEKTCVRG